jgi:hypothetical protein
MDDGIHQRCGRRKRYKVSLRRSARYFEIRATANRRKKEKDKQHAYVPIYLNSSNREELGLKPN